MRRPRNNENNALSADFVFPDSESTAEKTKQIITFSTHVQMAPTISDRSIQENKLMGGILDSTADLALTKEMPDAKGKAKESSPKSCIKIFALGVINNLAEAGKCFGIK